MSDDPVFAGIPTFSGDVIARYRRGADGQTPCERETGRNWSRQSPQCAGFAVVREAREESTDRSKIRDHDVGVRFGNHRARTESVIGLTSAGVVIGSCDIQRARGGTRTAGKSWEARHGSVHRETKTCQTILQTKRCQRYLCRNPKFHSVSFTCSESDIAKQSVKCATQRRTQTENYGST